MTILNRREIFAGSILFLLARDSTREGPAAAVKPAAPRPLACGDDARLTANVRSHGAKGDGATNDQPAIQAAIDALACAGGGTLHFPAGTYLLRDRVELASRVRLLGDGDESVLKVGAPSGFVLLNATQRNIRDVTIERLAFDGSVNYPASSRVYKQRYALANQAISAAGVAVTRLCVKNCSFTHFAGRSIHVQSDAARGISILDNRFNRGAYTEQVIYIRSATPTVTDAIRPADIEISRNRIEGGGPEYHWDPSLEDWVASCDAIALDRCRNFLIKRNVIRNSASIGIRIEESIAGRIEGNELADVGADGIACYKRSRNILISGNSVRGWGKIPPAYAIRRYRDQLIYAREFPELTAATLPIDPTRSDWMGIWPFDTGKVDIAKVRPYSALDYYRGPSAGMLPFRGNTAITVNYGSTDCTVADNLCVGNLAKVGDKYVYASDFGFSTVHPANGNGVPGAGLQTTVLRNRFSQVRVRALNAPLHQDPRHRRGALGAVRFSANIVE